MKNIAEILKNCPSGTKLYSPICGECEFLYIDGNYIYISTPYYMENLCFTKSGKYFHYSDGECLLFPSKENRNWSIFNKPKNLAEEFGKIINNMSDEELNQKLKELEHLHNVGPKADEYLNFLEENKPNFRKAMEE